MDLTQLSSQLKLKTDFNADKSFGIRNINSITGIVDNSVTSLQALIFSNRNAEYDDFDPTKYDVTGITSGYDKKAFVFDLKRDYKLNLSSEITDHYVEDNLAIQDQIGLKPIILEVSGSISEVNLKDVNEKIKSSENEAGNNNDKGNIFNAIDSYLGRMGSLTSFAPNIVNQALDIYNSAKSVYNMTNKVINLEKQDKSQDLKEKYKDSEGYNLDIIKQTKQFEWVNWFKIQWWNRASFTIITPYGRFGDMYIMDLSATQPENSRYVTNLTIKFKQIRKAQVIDSRTRQSSRDRDTQLSKAEEERASEIEIEKKVIDAYLQAQEQSSYYKLPDNYAGVTQVTAEEFEKKQQEVRTYIVEGVKNKMSQNNLLNNRALYGGAIPTPTGI